MKSFRLLAFMLLGITALYVFAAAKVFAADVTVTWTHPTAFVDGTSLALGQIASTRVEYGSCSGTAFGTKTGEVTVNAPATTATISGFANGTTACFRVFTRTTAAAGGLESGPSGVAQKAFGWPAPNPPTIVTVNATAKLWRNGLKDRVGHVALNVPCDKLKKHVSGPDWYTVPNEAVTLNRYGRKLPSTITIVARCDAA